MANVRFTTFACAIVFPVAALAQQSSGASGSGGVAAHPDLSGVWTYAIDRAPAALKKEVNGQSPSSG